MKQILKKVLDSLKTRRRLINERDYAFETLDQLRSYIKICNLLDINKLQKFVLDGELQDPPRILPGSQVDLENNTCALQIQSWGIGAMTRSIVETFDLSEAENYLILSFTYQGQEYDVTVQKGGKVTPAQKASKLEAEVQSLKEELDKYKNVQT